ncbi:MAG: hypothetical protein ACHQNT_07250 [Bacteroidia bacterium]
MQGSKLTLSKAEIKLMSDSDFFIQKNSITKKVSSLLSELNDDIEMLKLKFEASLPPDALKIAGKISKGENYQGLPWMVLDNPRVFSNKNIFAFRTMFWWGNYFSFTFHLSGNYFQDCQKSILKNWHKFSKKGYLVCINNQPWVHHLATDNYQPMATFNSKKREQQIMTKHFFKISRKLDLRKWKDLKNFGAETFEEYVRLLGK